MQPAACRSFPISHKLTYDVTVLLRLLITYLLYSCNAEPMSIYHRPVKLLLFCLVLLVPAKGYAWKWERVEDFDITRRMGAIAFSWNGKGYVGFGHDYNARYAFNDINMYDPATGKWQEETWLDSGFRTGAFCFLKGDGVYIGGGTRDSGRTALQDFYRYDLSGKTWTPLRQLPFRFAFGAVATVCDGEAWVLGGCTTEDCEKRIWRYDIEADQWLQADTLPVRSQFGTAFALNHELYYGLGNGLNLETIQGIWKKHPDSAGWQRIHSFTEDGRTMCVAVAIDSIHTIAGLGFRMLDYITQPRDVRIVNGMRLEDVRPEADFMKSDFWLYNALTNKWRRLPSQPKGRRGAIGFTAGGYLYVGMGNAENRINKDIYRLNLSRAIR